MTFPELLQKRAEILALANQYHTTRVRVFGSLARGQAAPSSDVDFLITPGAGCTLFDLGGLLEELQLLLQCKVDLVTEDGLKPGIREHVLREAVPL
jgi:uncharacterized protein